MVSLSLQGSLLVSSCLAWFHLVSRGVCRSPGICTGPQWYSLVSMDQLWSSLFLPGLSGVSTGLHGSLLGLHCFFQVSRDQLWSSLFLLGLSGVSAGLQGSVLVSRGFSDGLPWSPEVSAGLTSINEC